ncbi:hypothetical protein BDZ94DRAFT_1322036 [Collybia nuda]|uniref:Uncharacterized protein n=1 Tax=Collybia nuda TaxID=64659 RepID=A0A9P5Y5M8_9AGAR|nr:hypothetical protein BDZ94DRAFT_1322036 [Collybia nuda]
MGTTNDEESDWEDPSHELYPFGDDFNCAGIFRADFVELKNKIRDARGGKLDDVAKALIVEHLRVLNAVTTTFPANWPEHLRIRYDKALSDSERKGPPDRFEPGRLQHYIEMHAIYETAMEGITAADAAFQDKKAAAAKKGILGDRDREWIIEVLDAHHGYWEMNLKKEKNYELQVLWLKEHGETAEFEQEKMVAFWRERQSRLAAESSSLTAPKSEKTKKVGFFKKLFK